MSERPQAKVEAITVTAKRIIPENVTAEAISTRMSFLYRDCGLISMMANNILCSSEALQLVMAHWLKLIPRSSAKDENLILQTTAQLPERRWEMLDARTC